MRLFLNDSIDLQSKKNCLPLVEQEYQLDSAHFNTLPGLSWQAALK
jgi:hypothetical protein